MTALCWQQWVKHYSDKGYFVIAQSWPGMESDTERLRVDPSSFASLGLIEVVGHYEQIIRDLETVPIIIGHGVGGLVTQILLDRGWGAAGVAIASAPVKGVSWLPLSILKMALLGVGNGKAQSLTATRFHHTFANTLSEEQSLAAFERYVVPGPTRIMWQTAFASFNPNAASTVNVHNDARAPLLLVAGGKDRVVPKSMVKGNFNRYCESKADTDYKEFPDQTHFSLLRETDVADYALGWALYRANGSKLTAVSNQTDTWSVQLST